MCIPNHRGLRVNNSLYIARVFLIGTSLYESLSNLYAQEYLSFEHLIYKILSLRCGHQNHRRVGSSRIYLMVLEGQL